MNRRLLLKLSIVICIETLLVISLTVISDNIDYMSHSQVKLPLRCEPEKSLVQETQEKQDMSYSGHCDASSPETLVKRIPDAHSLPPHGASCKLLFEGDRTAVKNAELHQKEHPHKNISETDYIQMTLNCKTFLRDRNYLTCPLSEEEAQFPIAYSILMYKDVEQFERLLRAIYRPQNYYCVHVDAKAPSMLHMAVSGIVGCLPNVFLASTLIDVTWGTFTTLEPEIVCMRDLWKYKKWRYFINLTGQEFPLKTNLDIVRILKSFKGANHIDGQFPIKVIHRLRWMVAHKGLFLTWRVKPPFPGNITAVKGCVHIVVQRAFVDYILHNCTAIKLLEWVQDVKYPDELYFSTLNFSPDLQIPGTYGGPQPFEALPFVNRYKRWSWETHWRACRGKYVRSICIPGVGDLSDLAQRPELFVNKLHLDYQPVVIDCLEELVSNWTRAEVLGERTFNASAYGQMSFVKHRIRPVGR